LVQDRFWCKASLDGGPRLVHGRRPSFSPRLSGVRRDPGVDRKKLVPTLKLWGKGKEEYGHQVITGYISNAHRCICQEADSFFPSGREVAVNGTSEVSGSESYHKVKDEPL